MGGAGSAVGECMAVHGLALPLLQLGLPDKVIEHGDPNKLLSMCGLDAAGIEQAVLKRFGSRLTVVRPAANRSAASSTASAASGRFRNRSNRWSRPCALESPTRGS